MTTSDASRLARRALLATLALAPLSPRLSWAEQHQDEAVRLLLVVKPLTPNIVAVQQQVADTFFKLRLIPQKLDVASAVWSPRS